MILQAAPGGLYTLRTELFRQSIWD
jgi:hypothetical protein